MEASGGLSWDEPWLTVDGSVFRTISPTAFLDALRRVDGARQTFAEAAGRATPSGDPPLLVWKSRSMIEGLARLIDDLRPRRILELGIAQGGSTALLALLAPQADIVALELSPTRVAALDEFVARRGQQQRVRAHYGVDQSDADAVRAVLDDEFGGEPVDLVIDDASHQLALSRASIDVVLPRVRPGGCYVVEDWAWAHDDYAGIDDESVIPSGPPLTALVVEALMSLGSRHGAISALDSDEMTVRLWRGDAELADGWTISGSYVSTSPVLFPGLAGASRGPAAVEK